VVVTEYWYFLSALERYMMTEEPLGAKPSVERGKVNRGEGRREGSKKSNQGMSDTD
jgi:hypothetical protein